MGELEVPDAALWGASTQRAVENFPVSGHRLPVSFIRTLGLVKWACARANEHLGMLPRDKAELIAAAALEIHDGKLDDQFPVDVFQTGSGTSSNMNANEVIANRINREPGRKTGDGGRIHPNDDVNLGQSSNDVFPTTLHLSVALALRDDLVPALASLNRALERKSEAWQSVVKPGRTHLMDAVPMTLGQEFSGYARQIEKSIARCHRGLVALEELAIGGTAVGTGLNTHVNFGATVCELLSRETGLNLREAGNHFEAQAARDDCVEVAGHLQAVSAALTKIANDIRLLGSGPRTGLAEITLPATQPGSSIMPGKVNPVMCEMLVQTCMYAAGLCSSIAAAGKEGFFELNTTLPLMAYCGHESIACLARAVRLFTARCVEGLLPNEQRCRDLAESSLMLATALAPLLGYDRAAQVAKRAFAENRTVREIAEEEKVLDSGQLATLLNPARMISNTAPDNSGKP
jgi:fumarate hydratase class II